MGWENQYLGHHDFSHQHVLKQRRLPIMAMKKSSLKLIVPTREMRPLTAGDLKGVLVVQEEVYTPRFIETETAFSRKLALFPEGCLGCFEMGVLIGYAFAHPWRAPEIVALDAIIDELPLDADCLYIHDIAVTRRHWAEGIAKRLVIALINVARSRGLNVMAGVAVQGSETAWKSLGFVVQHRFEYVPGGSGCHVVMRL
jgi:GNAT superfamily N-acetyltransferase